MAKRTGGFIGQDGINAPDQATGVTGTAGDEQVNVSFTSPSDVGGAAITEYRVTDSTGDFGATGSASPITVSGLTNGTSYTFNVWAINPFGWSSPSDASGSVSPVSPIGVFAGGFNGSSQTNVISYVTIATTGNSSDFGDLTRTWDNDRGSATSSSTRGLFSGGSYVNIMDYITFSSAGNATDFGNLTTTAAQSGAVSNGTTAVIGLGQQGNIGTYGNILNARTIATTGNAYDFGDMSINKAFYGSCESPTRGIFAGGGGGDTLQIDYFTFSDYANTADFGDLTGSSFRYGVGGASSATRGVFAGGQQSGSIANILDYITIATTGNATDFGDLLTSAFNLDGCSNNVRAVYAGINDTSNTIQYVTVATTGNATDFGDLAQRQSGAAACSNGHGGLQ